MPAATRPAPSTSSSSAPASPACTCCTGCAGSACRRGCSRRAAASAAPGTGTATRARAATSRAWSTPTRSRTELQQEWEWSERYAAQPEILRYANHVADRFDLRRDIQFDTRVTAARFDEATQRWDGRDRPRRPRVGAVSASWRPAACRRAQVPDFPGSRRFAGTTYHTGALAARGRRLHRPARRRDRHRLVGDPVDPDHRRSRPAQLYRVPAHAELQRAGAQRAARPGLRAAVKADYADAPRAGAARRAPASLDRSERRLGAGGVATRSGSATTRSAGQRGGTRLPGARSTTCSSTRQANDTAAEFVRAKIRDDRARPGGRRDCWRRTTIRSAPSASASTPATTRPSTATTSRWSTCARRRSRRSRRRACARGDAEYELDSIVFATGFDAMTGALLDDRHPRPRRRDAAGEVGRRARAPTSGLTIAGLPEPVHHHRARAARRCSPT